jgi:hypothetical protein
MRRIATTLAAGTLVALAMLGTASASFGPSGDWGGTGSGNGKFNHPQGSLLDPSGRLYVADSDNGRIERFNASGTWLNNYAAGGSGFAPGDVAISGANLYAASAGRIDVWSIPLGGLHLRSTSTAYNAYGITADPAGITYVSDPDHGLIHVYNAAGTERDSWDAQGAGYGLTTDDAGSIYVAYSGSGRIRKFSPAGALEQTWDMPTYTIVSGGQTLTGQVDPRDVAVDGTGRVYAPDAGTHSNLVAVFGADGTLQQILGSPDSDPGNRCTLSAPWGLSASGGKLYVSSTGENRIRAFDESSAACPAPDFGAGGGISPTPSGAGGSNPSGGNAGTVARPAKPQIRFVGLPHKCARKNFAFQIEVSDDGVIQSLRLLVNGRTAARQRPGQSDWNVRVRMPVQTVRKQIPKGSRVKITVEVKVRDNTGVRSHLRRAFKICG